MDFRFTEEQQMLRESAAAFLREYSDSAAVRRAMAGESGFDPALWTKISGEMGWSALHIPETCGGLGLGAVELVALMEQMGTQLLCAPFFSSICLGATAILLTADDEQKARLLPGIAEGSVRATLAWNGRGDSWNADAITAQCTLEVASGNWIIEGEYRHVVDGHTADWLVVAARVAESQGEDGIRLFALPAATAGITRELLPTLDQTRKLAALRFDRVRVAADALLGGEYEAWPVLERALQIASIALAAEQAGGARQVLDMAVEYSKERKQFGRAIASFQAVKHKAADMLVRAEAARSAVYYAACVVDAALRGDPLGAELAEAASVAKAYCSEAYFFNAGCALQLFGGVGFTWEYDVHLHFKRARASEAFLGEPSLHRERIARVIGL